MRCSAACLHPLANELLLMLLYPQETHLDLEEETGPGFVKATTVTAPLLHNKQTDSNLRLL